MSARGMPSGGTGRPAKELSSPDSLGSAQPNTVATAKPFRRPTPKLHPTNGETVFDAKAFLARAGLGKQILKLKKSETAFVQTLVCEIRQALREIRKL